MKIFYETKQKKMKDQYSSDEAENLSEFKEEYRIAQKFL